MTEEEKNEKEKKRTVRAVPIRKAGKKPGRIKVETFEEEE